MPKKSLTLLLIIMVGITGLFSFCTQPDDNRFVSYTVKPNQIALYYKDNAGNRYGSLGNLKSALAKEGETLLFAMNGGMYKPNHSPQGLNIENYHEISPIDTTSGTGNFYLKPNGIFYIDRNTKPHITTTPDFKATDVKFATQSGPMLVTDGAIHSAFKEGSSNVQVRNGVGVLPNGRVIFAMSKDKINFYDFALYFKNLGCKNALYLDGFVSRMYCPEKGITQTDGDFGVIIGASSN